MIWSSDTVVWSNILDIRSNVVGWWLKIWHLELTMFLHGLIILCKWHKILHWFNILENYWQCCFMGSREYVRVLVNIHDIDMSGSSISISVSVRIIADVICHCSGTCPCPCPFWCCKIRTSWSYIIGLWILKWKNCMFLYEYSIVKLVVLAH
jgi:hypothetical protein